MKHSFLIGKPLTLEIVTAYPFGLQHDAFSIYPLWLHLAKCLSIIGNEVLAFNLVLFLNLLLSLIAMFSLSYYLTKDYFSSFISAIIYALCPYQFARIWQHFALTFTAGMPFYILCMIKLYSSGKVKDMFLCVLSFFLVIVFELHYAVFMFVTTAAFITYMLIFRRGPLKLNKLKVYLNAFFLTSVLSIVAILPFLIKIFWTVKTAKPSAFSIVRPFEDLFAQSVHPLSYFLPSAVHPMFGKFTQQFVGTSLYGVSFTEHTLYLGWVPIILAFVAFKRYRSKQLSAVSCQLSAEEKKYIGFFVCLAVVAWFFSQPPWWNIFGLKLYMPSFFMYKILPMFRAYCRFGIVVMLAVSVLAGFGLKFILERFRSNKTKIAVAILACGLVLFEFWNWPPYKVIDVSTFPSVYAWLKAQTDDIVIAEYPLDASSPNELYKLYQTKHEKKIINGTIPGTYANKVAQKLVKLSSPDTVSMLKWMGVKYVLVHHKGYLKTGLAEDRDELFLIPRNPGLKHIGTFPLENCPNEKIMCIKDPGQIDVYEAVTDKAIDPRPLVDGS
ncbi:MAG: hypothetical protein MUF05_03300 [Candidatus Omnitrophica bacterium]|nr:hypothetical protein [Candidatus Omnitrophota bacterium]